MSDKDKSAPQDDVFNIERIRRLVELMEQHDLSAVDLRGQGQRIRLRRGAPPSAPAAPAPVYAAPPPAAAPLPAAPAAAAAPAADGANIVVIKSPMVGTFYSKPNPDAESFVKVGSSVQTDTTICIIEAMKVFNEIPAEISGKVVAVLVENGKPVEYGKPLFKIDTKG